MRHKFPVHLAHEQNEKNTIYKEILMVERVISVTMNMTYLGTMNYLMVFYLEVTDENCISYWLNHLK